MKSVIYIEGGGDSKELRVKCREGFRKLLESAGDFEGKRPKLVSCGSRNSTFKDFKCAHENSAGGEYVAMLVDSEDPIDDIEKTWEHLRIRDRWTKPTSADDAQVLLMTTCMETWIITDRNALKSHFGNKLQESALPPIADMENRNRHDIQSKLSHATRNCKNAYKKDKRSFELVGILNPNTLKTKLPSFERVLRILKEKL